MFRSQIGSQFHSGQPAHVLVREDRGFNAGRKLTVDPQ